MTRFNINDTRTLEIGSRGLHGKFDHGEGREIGVSGASLHGYHSTGACDVYAPFRTMAGRPSLRPVYVVLPEPIMFSHMSQKVHYANRLLPHLSALCPSQPLCLTSAIASSNSIS